MVGIKVNSEEPNSASLAKVFFFSIETQGFKMLTFSETAVEFC